jgi:putative transcriptional regulator
MAKKRLFDDLKEGLSEAIAIAKGTADPASYTVHVPEAVDVKAIRKGLGLTQKEFARRYSFNPARLRDWEQGRSRPDGALRAYLIVIAKNPAAVAKALKAA